MVQLPVEQRTFVLTTFHRIGSIMKTREAFSLRFPDRDSSSRKTFCAHVHNANNMEQALPETRTILVGGGVEEAQKIWRLSGDNWRPTQGPQLHHCMARVQLCFFSVTVSILILELLKQRNQKINTVMNEFICNFIMPDSETRKSVCTLITCCTIRLLLCTIFGKFDFSSPYCALQLMILL